MVLVEGTDKDNRAEEYVWDFIILNNDGTYRIEDTKGVMTEVAKIKHKQFKDKYKGVQMEFVFREDI